MWCFSREGEQEKKSKDDDDSHPNVQQLTQLNWVDNLHWTYVGDDDDSGGAGNDIGGGYFTLYLGYLPNDLPPTKKWAWFLILK